MFRKHIAAMLSGFCLSMAGCDNPTDLTAPGATTVAIDTRNGSLLAASNTWTTKLPMPRARFDHEAGAANGVIYVVGGQTSTSRRLAKMDAYIVAINTWITRAPLPSARILMNGVSSIGGKLYVAGGVNGNSVPVRTLYVYHPRANTWTRKADLPAAGGCGAQGVIQGELYVYVGCGSGEGHFYRYTPTTDQWTTLAPPSGEHILGEGAAVAGRFYLVGNRMGSLSGDLLEAYNPATNSWTSRAPMPKPSSQVMASAVLNGKFYVAGGIDRDTDAPQATLRVYDPVTNTWTLKAPMPAPRSWSAAAAAGGQVFVLGGFDRNETVLAKVIAYTP